MKEKLVIQKGMTLVYTHKPLLPKTSSDVEKQEGVDIPVKVMGAVNPEYVDILVINVPTGCKDKLKIGRRSIKPGFRLTVKITDLKSV